MVDESAADDLRALLHQSIDAYNRRDFATMSRFLSQDVVYRPISSLRTAGSGVDATISFVSTKSSSKRGQTIS
jgi:hypothetical protein